MTGLRAAWLLVLALGACAETAGAPAGVELVIPAVRSNVAVPPAFGETDVIVRTFVQDADAAREVAGAVCKMDSDYFAATFRSPARLPVQDLGARAPVLLITCSDGSRSGAAQAVPRLGYTNGLGGWPAVGVAVGTGGDVGVSFGGWWGGGWDTAPGRQQVDYSDVRVTLR